MHSVKSPFAVLLPVYLILILLIGGCASTPDTGKGDAEQKRIWVEETLRKLTLEQKIGQMIMSRAYGYYFSRESDEYRRLEHLVRDHRFGGLIFFQGDIFEMATLINQMQQEAEVPLLIAADFEWGAAMRIRRATRFPEAMALGATRDSALAYQMGKAIGEETRAMGVHQNFAPVADVNNNPANPVINTRSFGEDPQLVAQMASAVSAGMQSAGVLATGKHFPGHGDTDVDSHLDLPRVPHARTRLDSIELVPFRTLIDRGIASMMVAHLEVPALQHQKTFPSTLSPYIIDSLLKGELHFQGLVVTDAMDMGALVNTFGSDSSAVRAVEAGTDILLILPDEDGAVTALVNAVTSGRIKEERINRSVVKILGAKFDVGLAANRFIDLQKIREVVGTPAHLLVAKDIARKSITVLKNDAVLPLSRSSDKKILNVIVADAESYRTEIHRTSSQWPNEPVGDYFMTQFRRRNSNVQVVRLNPTSNAIHYEAMTKLASKSDIILLTIFSKARSGSGAFGLPPEMISAIDSLSLLQKPVVVMAMGSPYTIGAVPDAAAYVCAYSDAEFSTEAAIEALFGEIPVNGKLPISIPGMFSFGEGLVINQTILRRDVPEAVGFNRDSLARLDSAMLRAIGDSAFPGAQLLVAKDGAIVFNKSFGTQEYFPGSAEINNATMFDLASVSKVVATTSAVMRLYDEGRIGLDDPVVKYLPQFGNRGKEGITLRNLLVHNGGLPAFKRLYLNVRSPEEALDSVYQTETIYRRGDSTVYSDFDFILLGKVVEVVSGVTLDRYVDSVFFEPLGLTQTMFNPPSALWSKIAPTEFDSVVRKEIVRGTVHDENAFVLGGVAGHAGLFSTASEVAVFLQMILNGGTYDGRQYLKPETVRLFTTRQGAKSTRALGWDTKTVGGYSSAGTLFSEKSFGHTGFTGTSVWVDPEKRIFVILLTNRVHPTRTNGKIIQVRPIIHDAVMHALTRPFSVRAASR